MSTETDVRMPMLSMEMGNGLQVGLQPRGGSPRKLDGPPFIESMTVKRKVRSFSASEWTMELYDGTGTLFEQILVAMYYKNTGPDGRLKYQMGSTSQSGEKNVFPPVNGLVRLVTPRYLREATRITIDGVDIDLEDAGANLSIEDIMQPNEAGTVKNWIEDVFGNAGVSIALEEKPDSIADYVTMAGFENFVNAGNNASTVVQRLSVRYNRGSIESVSITDFFRLVMDWAGSKGVDLRMRFDGMDEQGVLQLVVLCPAFSVTTLKTFVVNSQVKKKDSDFLRVKSFVPRLEPMASRIYIPPRVAIKTRDRFTRMPVEWTGDYLDNSGTVIGSGLLISKSKTDEARPPRVPSGMLRLPGSMEDILLMSKLDDMDRDVANNVRRGIQRTFYNFPISGRLVVEFPPEELVPYAHIRIKVMTKNGMDPITSGIYLVEDVVYSFRSGSFEASASVVKSGGRVLPGADKETVPMMATLVSDEGAEQ